MRKVTAIQIAIGTLAGAAVVTAGVIAGLKYWTGTDFAPSGNERGLKNNQVLFQQEPDTQATGGAEGEASSRWEKQEDAQRQESPQLGEGNFLFQFGDEQHSSSTGGLVGAGDQTDTNAPAPDHYFEISDGGSGSGGTGGAGDGDGNGTGGKEDPTTPTEPIVIPADPEPVKKDPPNDGLDEDDKFDEKTFTRPSDWDWMRLYYIRQDFESDSTVYAGQVFQTKESLEKTLFASMVTCFLDGNTFKRCLLTEAEYGIYIRIDGVSFDGGLTMEEDFPLTIPADTKMMVRVSYRFSTRSPWEPTEDEEPFWINYTVAQARVMVLSQNPIAGSTNIDSDTILNADEQYPTLGSNLNLLNYQLDMLVDDPDDLFWVFGIRLDSFYKGWLEDGSLVNWQYPVTPGRHVLLPGGYSPVPEGYEASVHIYPVNEDFEQDPLNGEGCYFQTVIQAPVSADGVLEIPEYAQAIFLDGTQGVRTLRIPSTLLLIPDQSGDGLEVQDAYEVAEDNPVFSSKDGLLLSKDGTVIRGVPTSITSLTVPEGIQAVRPLKCNNLEELHLEATSDLPQLRYENMQGITVYVAEELVTELCLRDADEIEEYNITVRSDKDSYTLKMPFLLDGEGGIKKLLKDEDQILSLPDLEPLIIREGAFAGTEVASTLTVSEKVGNIVLEDGCFRDSGVHLILCGTDEQVRDLRSQLDAMGETEIAVAKLKVSPNGYEYAELGNGQYRLVSAPEDITTFSVVDDVQITEIGNGAFSGCENLRWVTLPESVSLVERRAFEDCTALEGVVILNQQKITLQENAFSGCDALRFIGSNAVTGDVAYSLGDGLTFSGFFPYGGTGYPETTDYTDITWAASPGTARYDFYDCGSTRLLYAMDENNQPWRLLRAGAYVYGDLELPATTIEIALKAFQNVYTSFTINWEDLTRLRIIGSHAFDSSGLEGDVELSSKETVSVGTSAFQDCYGITSFRAESVNLDYYVFSGCTWLKTAEFRIDAYGNKNASLPAGLFFSCYNLESFTLNNEEPPALGWFSPGVWFCLRDNPDAADLLHVPAGSEEAYVEAWTYTYAGRDDRDSVWFDYYMDIGDMDLTDTAVAQWEGDVRRVIRNVIAGLDPADEPDPAEGFSWWVDDFGTVTLSGVPSDLEDLVLLGENIGLGVQGYVDYIGSGAFADCTQLKTVTIPYREIGLWGDGVQRLTGIESDAFYTGGDTLTVIFEDRTPPDLVPDFAGNFTFRGNGRVLIKVPEGCEDTYLQKWLSDLDGICTEEELLQMMGWAEEPELVEAEGFILERRDGKWVLTAVPADAESLTLDGETLGLPEGETLSGIAAGAFTGAAELKTVTLPESLETVESDAFNTSGDSLTLIFTGQTPPALLAGDDGFTFGLPEENIHLTVPQDAADAYLNQWKANLAGYESYAAALAATQEANLSWNESRVRQNTDSALLEQENRLRTMLGLPMAEDPLTHFAYTAVRGGIRLNSAPTYIDSIALNAETMGLDSGTKLLEINADAFQGCDLLVYLTLPDTVDAISSRAFTNATERLTLDMTAWTKDKTPPKLVLWDGKPFSFGLTRADAEITVLVADEETKQAFAEAWAPAFAGADSQEALAEQLLAAMTTEDMTAEALAEAQQSAAAQAQAMIRQAEAKLQTIIQVPQTPEEDPSGALVGAEE